MSGWRYKLFDCSEAPLACVWSCIVPCGIPCMQATVAKILINKDKAQAKACLLAACCCCFGIAFNRGEVRDELQIKGSYLEDLIYVWFCPCCSVVQEWREVMVTKGLNEDEPIWSVRKEYEQTF